VAITHDLNSVLHGRSQVIALKRGAVFFEDQPQVAMTPERLGALFDMPFHCLRDTQNGAQWIVPQLQLAEDGLR
jgi:ABC-type cobalamin/Fe3+-siderophores transport system ATPase subunit